MREPRKALEDALALIAEGEGQRVADMIHNAPPGAPIETKWGLGFRKYDECMDHIRRNNAIKAPEGGFALPLPYTVYERHDLFRRPVQRDLARPGARPKWRRSCARTSRTTSAGTSGSRR